MYPQEQKVGWREPKMVRVDCNSEIITVQYDYRSGDKGFYDTNGRLWLFEDVIEYL